MPIAASDAGNESSFKSVIRSLSDVMVHGIEVSASAERRARFDLWSPHEFLDAFRRCRSVTLGFAPGLCPLNMVDLPPAGDACFKWLRHLSTIYRESIDY